MLASSLLLSLLAACLCAVAAEIACPPVTVAAAVATVAAAVSLTPASYPNQLADHARPLPPCAMYDHMLLAARGCAELRHLEAYISSEHKRGRRMLELYELVQHAGNVLPRLYLLLTVGSVYIVSQEAAAKDILTDLVEMCRGVQHPMRGLFLRNYLAQASKSKLPDTGSEYEGAGGTVADAVSFVLSSTSKDITKTLYSICHSLQDGVSFLFFFLVRQLALCILLKSLLTQSQLLFINLFCSLMFIHQTSVDCLEASRRLVNGI